MSEPGEADEGDLLVNRRKLLGGLLSGLGLAVSLAMVPSETDAQVVIVGGGRHGWHGRHWHRGRQRCWWRNGRRVCRW